MASPLITTKLHVPMPRQDLVSRPYLLRRLGEGLAGKLTLISASTGYGKTTLMAAWCAGPGREYPLAWLSLDEADNDPVRFLIYLLAALQNVQVGLGDDVGALLQGSREPADTALLSLLVNELALIPNNFVLVLEDYHVISNREIHQSLRFLLDHMPPQMHLAILTRADPPFPLARLRAQGALVEIRAQELRFTFDDTTEFLRAALGAALAPEGSRILMERTEGWIAGLQLAALSLRGRADPNAEIAAFGGGNAYIVDLLIEEVLDRQSESTRMFLLQTSILRRLNGSLCDALTGQSDGEATLAELEKANLFVSYLGGDGRWYRYHRLFADVMATLLLHTYPELPPALHRRAARWYAQNQLLSEAIDHALSARDHQLAAAIVQATAMDLLKEGALSTLAGWLDRLPEAVVAERPWLGVDSGWINLLTGQLDKVEGYLIVAEAGAATLDNAADLRGHIATIRAYAAAMQGHVEQALTQARYALDLLSQDDLTTRCVVTFVLGGIQYMRQEFPAAIETMRAASRLGEQAGNLHVAVPARCAVGDLLRQQGELDEAEAVLHAALQLSNGRAGNPLPIAANAYIGLADIALARGELADARRHASQGLELGNLWNNADNRVSGYLTMAQVEHLTGNPDQAHRLLAQARQLAAAHTVSPTLAERFQACEVVLRTEPGAALVGNALPDPLTEREREVLLLFAQGLSNQEVAGRLVVSLGTVKAHSSNIYRKLDVRNRAQAVIRAQELKLLA